MKKWDLVAKIREGHNPGLILVLTSLHFVTIFRENRWRSAESLEIPVKTFLTPEY